MKILWISDCPDNSINTGYATATRLIATELMSRGHQFVFGSQGSQDANVMDISVNQNRCRSYGFGKGKFLQPEAVKEIDRIEKPDIIVTMADWQMVEGMMGISGHAAFQKWICYAPVDGEMLSTHWDFMIHNIPFIVYMSPLFGSSVCRHRRFGYEDYVPLPIALAQHWLMPEEARKALKKTCKNGSGWKEDTLTVMTVARNQWRKNYPEIIKAAAILRKSHPGRLSFVLHCKPVEIMGWDLPKLIDYYGCGDCVAISEQELSPEDKNKLYNSADLFLLPSLGEGFGIPIVEAALYKLPVFTTADTANYDLLRLMRCEAGGLPFEVQWQTGPTIPRPFVSAQTIADALAVYLAEGCPYDLDVTQNIAQYTFNAHTVCDSWENIFTKAAEVYRQRIGDFRTSIVRGEMIINAPV